MNRRHFILHSSGSLAAASIPVFTPMSAAAIVHSVIPEADKFVSDQAVKKFTSNDWQTIAIVQSHFLPSEEHAPGAVEINALQYLYQYLNNPITDPLDIDFVLSGTRLLQKETQSTAIDSPQTSPVALMDQSIEQREITLRNFEKQPEGRRWLVTILNYVLEALLSDPVYGGNPDGIGWQWLEHRAGDPHPPMNKRYWLL